MALMKLSLGFLGVLIALSFCQSASFTVKRNLQILQGDEIYETFKHNLVRYHGVSEEFAEQFKLNLRRAVNEELQRANLRQGGIDEDEEEDDEETTTVVTTAGPSAFNIVNGIYGILMGVGTLNPDRVFASTANFFPPSQKETANALISNALGKPGVTFPTPTTTIPTTTKLTTSTKDPDDYDEDEDETTKSAVQATPAPSAAASATLAPAIEKYTLKPKEPMAVGAAATAAPVASVAVTAAPSGSISGSTVQDDEIELELSPIKG